MASPAKPGTLRIDGEVEQPVTLAIDDLAGLDPAQQVPDVKQLDPKRGGQAVRLSAILALVRPRPSARYLGLHSSTDDFHASIPLEAVADRALVIYRLEGRPLTRESGGPLRFVIPNYAQCHTAEVDECANVKHIDHLELTRVKGFDNRPTDEQEHEELHERQ